MSREEAEVLVLREVDTATLRWPDDTDLDDYGSSSNRLYRDMRAFSWDDAANALDLEETLLSAHGWDLGAAQEGLADEDLFWTLWDLDIGVASTVLALSAAGCVPTSSCSGGSGHTQPCPVVKFFSPPSHVPDLLAVASEAGCGLVDDADGSLLVYSASVADLLRFARSLIGLGRAPTPGSPDTPSHP